MRPRRSTVVVFVVVAVGWSLIGSLTLHHLRESSPSDTSVAGLDILILSYAHFLMSWPGVVYVDLFLELMAPNFYESWQWSSALLAARHAAMVVFWATLVTVAFVLIRRLRERRAASNGA